MRVDFYQLSRDPAPQAVALIARNVLKAGERLLVVADDDGLLDKVSEALWQPGESFLAHGKAGGHDARQPILLSATVEPANGARYLALADGQWRDTEGFERIFLFFDAATLGAARETWKALRDRPETERHFWKQEGSRWVEAG